MTKDMTNNIHKWGFYLYVDRDDGNYNLTGAVDAYTIPPRPSYSISYNANGGSGTTSGQTKWHDIAIDLRANGYSRSGYSFKRWNTSSNDGGTGYNASATYSGNSNLTLYAIWNRTVTFNANGGSGAPSAQTAVATSAITLSSTKPTRSGYTFKRWNTNTSDTGTGYNSGGSYAANNPSVTLYAIWNRTVTYNGNAPTGATVSNVPSAQTSIDTTAITLSSTTPTCSGYTFKRWNSSSTDASSGQTYSPGGTYAASKGSITLYAIWNRTVTYNANGHGTAPSSQTAVATSNITLGSISEAGWKFLGWYTAETGGTRVGGAGDTYSGATVTLYAHWKRMPKIDIIDTIRASEYSSNIAYYPLGTGDFDDELTDIAYDPISSKYTGHIEARSFNGATITSVTAKVSGDTSATSLSLTSVELSEDDYVDEYGSSVATDDQTASHYLLNGKPYSQDFAVVYRVTDSDGDYSEFTATVPKTPNYTSPTVSIVSCERCTIDGEVDDEGTYVKLELDIDTYVLPPGVSSVLYDRRLHVEIRSAEDRTAFNGNLDIDETIGSTLRRDTITKTIGMAHSYELTEDESIDSEKTYYVLSGGSYSAVSEPDVSDIATYYEQSSVPWLFDENTSYKTRVNVSDGLETSPIIIETITTAFFTMDVLSDAYRGEYELTDLTSLEGMSLGSGHEAPSFYIYRNGRYFDVRTNGLVLPLAECDYTEESKTDKWLNDHFEIGGKFTLSQMPTHYCTLSVSYCAMDVIPPGVIATAEFDLYESSFTYGTAGTDTVFSYDGDRTFTLLRVPTRDYVTNLEIDYTYPDIDYDDPGDILWFIRTDDISVDQDKTYYVVNANFTGQSWCSYRMMETTSPEDAYLSLYYEDVTETLNPKTSLWYELNPNPTGPRGGHGVSFGAPSTHEGFNVSFPEYHYEHPVLPVYKGDDEPDVTDMLWINTADGNVMKFHDGTGWVYVGSVWG